MTDPSLFALDAATPAPADGYTPEFEEWLAKYPNRRGKKQAQRSWNARRRQGVTFDQLAEARDNYVRATVTSDAGYLKHPSTLINEWSEWVKGGSAMGSGYTRATPKRPDINDPSGDDVTPERQGIGWNPGHRGDAPDANPETNLAGIEAVRAAMTGHETRTKPPQRVAKKRRSEGLTPSFGATGHSSAPKPLTAVLAPVAAEINQQDRGE